MSDLPGDCQHIRVEPRGYGRNKWHVSHACLGTRRVPCLSTAWAGICVQRLSHGHKATRVSQPPGKPPESPGFSHCMSHPGRLHSVPIPVTSWRESQLCLVSLMSAFNHPLPRWFPCTSSLCSLKHDMAPNVDPSMSQTPQLYLTIFLQPTFSDRMAKGSTKRFTKMLYWVFKSVWMSLCMLQFP